MRVLITVPSLGREFGGPAAKARALSEALSRLDIGVRVVGCGESDWAVGIPVLAKLHATPIPTRTAPIRREVAGCDLVHILGYRDPVGTVAAAAARRRRIPYILEPVGMYGPKLRSARIKALYERWFGARLVEEARTLIATSAIEERELVEAGIDGTRIMVRPNGVDVDGLIPLPERGAFRAAAGLGDGPLVLVVSRISMTKGLLGFADAIRMAPELTAVIAGPDDGDGTLVALRRFIARHRLEYRLKVMPAGLWGSDKAQAMADADCFALPSATESFGIAAAEAACVGLPVVVSDRCGGKEWFGPRSTRSFPYGDNQALADALVELSTDPAAASDARADAERIRGELAWSHIAERQAAIYREVLG